MSVRRWLGGLVSAMVVGGAIAGGYATRGVWLPRLLPATSSAGEVDPHAGHDHSEAPSKAAERVKLSATARANLKLIVRPAQSQVFWRSLVIPGAVIDRPGLSDRGVVAPVQGVVTQILIRPGETVARGERLFVLRILSEAVLTAQAELHKTLREIQFTQAQKAVLEGARGALSEARFLEVDNQIKRLTLTAQALRTDLRARGLTPDQVTGAGEGRLVTELTVSAPPAVLDSGPASAAAAAVSSFEVQELRVNLGEQVQAGQTLCLLADHRDLLVEGRAFKQEAPAIARAAEQGWEVRVEFADDDPAGWPPFDDRLPIAHLANSVDPVSRTFGVFLPLTNQVRSFERGGRTQLLWRFRPGQRARLHIPVERLDGVIVLPADAVVREGAEAFVFRQNGDVFERKPVHVVFDDPKHAVIAADGAIAPGQFVAHNAAAALNRAMKAPADAGGDSHAGHNHDH